MDSKEKNVQREQKKVAFAAAAGGNAGGVSDVDGLIAELDDIIVEIEKKGGGGAVPENFDLNEAIDDILHSASPAGGRDKKTVSSPKSKPPLPEDDEIRVIDKSAAPKIVNIDTTIWNKTHVTGDGMSKMKDLSLKDVAEKVFKHGENRSFLDGSSIAEFDFNYENVHEYLGGRTKDGGFDISGDGFYKDVKIGIFKSARGDCVVVMSQKDVNGQEQLIANKNEFCQKILLNILNGCVEKFADKEAAGGKPSARAASASSASLKPSRSRGVAMGRGDDDGSSSSSDSDW